MAWEDNGILTPLLTTQIVSNNCRRKQIQLRLGRWFISFHDLRVHGYAEVKPISESRRVGMEFPICIEVHHKSFAALVTSYKEDRETKIVEDTHTVQTLHHIVLVRDKSLVATAPKRSSPQLKDSSQFVASESQG